MRLSGLQLGDTSCSADPGPRSRLQGQALKGSGDLRLEDEDETQLCCSYLADRRPQISPPDKLTIAHKAVALHPVNVLLLLSFSLCPQERLWKSAAGEVAPGGRTALPGLLRRRPGVLAFGHFFAGFI